MPKDIKNDELLHALGNLHAAYTNAISAAMDSRDPHLVAHFVARQRETDRRMTAVDNNHLYRA
jgi:hypothetical protein